MEVRIGMGRPLERHQQSESISRRVHTLIIRVVGYEKVERFQHRIKFAPIVANKSEDDLAKLSTGLGVQNHRLDRRYVVAVPLPWKKMRIEEFSSE